MISLVKIDNKLIHVFNTSVGMVQYGIPPMTVSECLSLYNDVPTYFIIPQKQFNKEEGLLVILLEAVYLW